MKKLILSAAVAAVAVAGLAAKKGNDPVLMTVDGKPVLKSEFEYLYNKNNAQQVQPQTLDQYLQMFINYKLKVAEAEAEKLDATPEIQSEFRSFKGELAAPYMTDSATYYRLMDEAYKHNLREVKVSHIMLPMGMSPDENKTIEQRADSIRTAVLNGGDWNQLAEKYSVDRNSNKRGGLMGWISVGRLPWAFEKAAYDTEVGQISPVVNSGFGYHIIRTEASRPARGEAKARHILKLTLNKSDEEKALAKHQTDSLYSLIMRTPNIDFAALARDNSDDAGSARNGGLIDWFGAGMMVAEFDSVAFALPEGAISQPFTTQFGYHIVKNEGHRPVPSFAEMRTRLLSQINNDERGAMPRQNFIDSLMRVYKGHVLDKGLDQVEQLVANNPGGYDSVAIAKLKESNIPVIEIGGKTTPVSAVMGMMPVTRSKDAKNARILVKSAADNLLQQQAMDLQREHLYNPNTDYRNLVNEYRDGILLFEISNRNVWDKAAKDKAGIDEFFKKNRSKYTWDKPKYKGFIIFAQTDSMLNEAKKFTDALPKDFDRDSLSTNMRKKFGNDVRVERIIAAKGDNAISDYLFFGGELPKDATKNWNKFYGFGGHLAQQPEEAIDVRGQVTADYQNALERQWVQDLRKRHKVKVNDKVLKTVK